jgi:polysaccharide export outer membrane protein
MDEKMRESEHLASWSGKENSHQAPQKQRPIVTDSTDVLFEPEAGGIPMTATLAVQGRTACRRAQILGLLLSMSMSCLTASGCAMAISPEVRGTAYDAGMTDIPAEMQKVSIPPYRVEAPDILSIETVNNIRPENDTLRAGDELVVRVSGLYPVDPAEDQVEKDFKQINGVYRIQSDGSVDLGPEYGSVVVEGLTLRKAKTVIARHLRDETGLQDPKVAVNLPNVNGKQQITGEHLIRPDGTVSLGVYGSVYVNGMNLDQVKVAVEEHLAGFIHNPEVQVDVLAYNSKVIYIVADGGGSGESVVRVPFTGNETVLDVMSQVDGLSEVACKNYIWVARPGPHGSDVAQKMFVDWRGITQDAITTTNYQLLPGDRIYVKADAMIAADSFIAKFTVPMSRIFGVILLGNGTVNSIKRGANGGGNTGAGVF